MANDADIEVLKTRMDVLSGQLEEVKSQLEILTGKVETMRIVYEKESQQAALALQQALQQAAQREDHEDQPAMELST